MPMPAHDPHRFFEAVLADPSHKLPMPDRGGRLFAAAGEMIDSHELYYAAALADGSLRRKPAPGPSDAEPAAPAAEPSAPTTEPGTAPSV